MKTQMICTSLLFIACIVLSPTKVHATDYEEITYDDLINRISKKRNSIQSNSSHPLDSILLHAGFGLVSSFNNLNVEDHNFTRQLNGFQITAGIDLFSPDWMAEGAIVNFGTDTTATESRSLREFDMKVVYKNHLPNDINLRFGFGFATRDFRYSDLISGANFNDTTPAWLGTAGVESQISKYFGVAAELGLKSAMISRTIDKSAIDFSLRFNSYF